MSQSAPPVELFASPAGPRQEPSLASLQQADIQAARRTSEIDPLRTICEWPRLSRMSAKFAEMDDLKLLSPPTNFAVVQLPERRFPGVVLQGDSLHSLVSDLEAAAIESDPAEREAILSDLIDRFKSVREHYETVLSREGIERPYFRE